MSADPSPNDYYLTARPPKPQAFPSPFQYAPSDWGECPDNFDAPYVLAEIKVIAAMYAIRRKPEWKKKIKMPEVQVKWREELLQAQPEDEPQDDSEEERTFHHVALREVDVDYLLAALSWEADQPDLPGGIMPSVFDRVFQSATLIATDLLAELQRNILPLENVPEDEKDYHPGSDKQVIDLVHPSLFPVRYGKTWRKPSGVDPELVNAPRESGNPFAVNAPREPGNPFAYPEDRNSRSEKYQWLPTDFEISSTGEVKILSYINNLHPTRHALLYETIASVFSKFVPLFEETLTSLLNFPKHHFGAAETYGSWWDTTNEPPFPARRDDWSSPEARAEMAKWEEQYNAWEATKTLNYPEPAKFDPVGWEAELAKQTRFSLRGRTVQVVTKLATISLTPEKPDYPGGTWHIEGMADERIVASGIFYFDNENINDQTGLDFRGTFDDTKLEYEQGDDRGVLAVFGVRNEEACHQLYPRVATIAPLCLTFPNIYQHRVTPFSLQDPSQPGHRKILVFFLVDPLRPIPSTTIVSPQQLDWLIQTLEDCPNLPKLPSEIWLKIAADAGYITEKEAKADREELMAERKYLKDTEGGQFYERPFSLCEH